MSVVYYNEFDRHAAEWLRNLMRDGVLPHGVVDERDIRQVQATDLRGFTQCHFFAGIGGWAEAIRLARWPARRPVWTGSCPCQPYSSAGKGLGDKDPRNLWPEFYRLIRECRPHQVFGEQVEGAIGKGWLDRVQADLEGEGYAVGHCVFGAHSVGAPHIRQRLYWVGSRGVGLADPSGGEQRRTRERRSGDHRPVELPAGGHRSNRVLADAEGERRGTGREREARGRRADEPERLRVPVVVVGDTPGVGPQGDERRARAGNEPVAPGSGGVGFWADYELLPCRDGKARRTQPGLFPLAHGVSGRVAVVCPEGQRQAAGEGVRLVNRVGALKGAGNAIVPQDAAEFVAAFLETEGESCH